MIGKEQEDPALASISYMIRGNHRKHVLCVCKRLVVGGTTLQKVVTAAVYQESTI